jgi:hypothetical protein
MKRTLGILAIATVLASACEKKPAPSTTVARSDSATGANGMAGMQMDTKGMKMMPAMRAHLDSMASMSPDQMQAMMAAHQAQMSEMMDAMGADMRGMKMTVDPSWTAVSDSVRRDLADLTGLSGQPLKTRMQAHAGRVRRLTEMHERMMKM